VPDLNAELQRLSVLKHKSERVGQYKADRTNAFKIHQDRCLDLMEAMRCKSWRNDEDGTLYTRVEDRVKGQVEDRRLYIRWCLEQDEGVQEFLNDITCDRHPSTQADFVQSFYELLVNGLELVAVKEKQDRANAQARAHIDDEAPLPPGLTFRPDPYIQQRRS
jgi:hypothetical protein